MNLLNKMRALLKRANNRNQTLPVSASPTTPIYAELAERLARMERNYLVLLKRVLEMDGVKVNFANKATSRFSQKVLHTSEDKGLNGCKPTYH